MLCDYLTQIRYKRSSVIMLFLLLILCISSYLYGKFHASALLGSLSNVCEKDSD